MQKVQDNDIVEIQKAYDKMGYLDTKVTSN
jgi:hypothetical protein